MKKIFVAMITMGLVLMVGGTITYAAEPGRGRYFVDADGDGICDNADSMCTYADSDGDGVCDNYASGQCHGRGHGCGYGGRGNGFRGGRCR